MVKNAVMLALACLVAFGLFASKADAIAESLGRVRVYHVTVTSSPTKMVATSGYQPTSAFKFKNGATEIFCGGSDVNSATDGWTYAASEVDAIDASPTVVYCTTAAGTSDVTVLAGTKG